MSEEEIVYNGTTLSSDPSNKRNTNIFRSSNDASVVLDLLGSVSGIIFLIELIVILGWLGLVVFYICRPWSWLGFILYALAIDIVIHSAIKIASKLK